MKLKILDFKEGHFEEDVPNERVIAYLKDKFPSNTFVYIAGDAHISIDIETLNMQINQGTAPEELIILPRMKGGSEKEKVKVLWLSRHKPLPIQLDIFYNKLKHFDLIQYDKRVSNADHVMEIIQKYSADILVPVLPQTIISHLLPKCIEKGIKVLRADMELIHECIDGENCRDFDIFKDTCIKDVNRDLYRHYRFKTFKVLKEIKIIEEDF